MKNRFKHNSDGTTAIYMVGKMLQITIIDTEDFPAVSKHDWAYRGMYPISTRTSECLHTVIMPSHKGKDCDHIDGNKLNNKKSNLRICTRADNCHNSKTMATNKAGVKGVYWLKKLKCFTSTINVNGKKIHLGYFSNRVEAGEAYKIAALKNYRQFAYKGDK